MHYCIENANEMKASVSYTVYLDYEKFDKVPHSVILGELRKFGMDLCFIELSSSYPDGRTQFVKVDNLLSDTIGVVSGVPVDSLSGPYSFLFINGLPAIFLN